MKLISYSIKGILCSLFLILADSNSNAQVCNGATEIYGLTNNASVRRINYTTGAVATSNLNANSSTTASMSNGLGYNSFNGRFYYFRRNPGGSTPSFVSFSPIVLLNGETVHANCPTTNTVLTGCVSFNGLGYYCLDNTGKLYYYRISNNTWTLITSSLRLSNGTDVTATITNLSGGDIAIDGLGSLWIVASSDTKYCLYKVTSALPTTAVASLTVSQIVSPNTNTPSGSAFAGICFNATGQIILGTRTDNRLYRLNNNLSLTLLSTMSISGYGNDLTSCAFPLSVLPIVWKTYQVVANANGSASINWLIDAESNEKEFYVETSANGINWTELGKVSAKPKTGTDLNYSFTTANVLNGINYFRIRQVDLDNNVSYSEIKTLNISKEVKVEFWPNPAQEYVNIRYNKPMGINTKAQIFDQSGRLIKELTLQQVSTQINISNLVSGTYFVKVQFSDGDTFKQSFIKL